MTDEMPLVDDRYTSGVWYDATVGQFFTYDRDKENREVALHDPITGEKTETLGYDEFVEMQDDLLPVPEEAVQRPVEYFENKVGRLIADRMEFDAGLHYADMSTEVVEVEE